MSVDLTRDTSSQERDMTMKPNGGKGGKGQGKMPRQKYTNWGRDETMKLVSIWNDTNIQKKLGSNNVNVYTHIMNLAKAAGINKSEEQIKSKMAKLRAMYSVHKAQKNTSGMGRTKPVDPELITLLDDILGPRDIHSGSTLDSDDFERASDPFADAILISEFDPDDPQIVEKINQSILNDIRSSSSSPSSGSTPSSGNTPLSGSPIPGISGSSKDEIFEQKKDKYKKKKLKKESDLEAYLAFDMERADRQFKQECENFEWEKQRYEEVKVQEQKNLEAGRAHELAIANIFATALGGMTNVLSKKE